MNFLWKNHTLCSTSYLQEDSLADTLGDLLPEAQGEDYDEQALANRMKKKKKKGSRL